MSNFLRYTFDVEKFPHALAYLLHRVGPSTRLRIAKLLYLADRMHLVLHGRPILGDRYVALSSGPAPSMAIDILEDLGVMSMAEVRDLQVPTDFTQKLAKLVSVDATSQNPMYRATGTPDVQRLSDTDRSVLDEIHTRFGSWTVGALIDFTHKQSAWKNTVVPREINLALCFDDEPGAKREVLEYLLETQDDRDLVDRLWLTSPSS